MCATRKKQGRWAECSAPLPCGSGGRREAPRKAGAGGKGFLRAAELLGFRPCADAHAAGGHDNLMTSKCRPLLSHLQSNLGKRACPTCAPSVPSPSRAGGPDR